MSILAVASFDGFRGAALGASVVAIGAAVAWLLFAAEVWARRVPRLPRAGPETATLGPEPPAVANLLVNGWRVTAPAVPATLLDLAARDVVGIDAIGAGHSVVRMRHTTPDPLRLAPYERQVLDLVRSRATGGSAPVEVLRLGADDNEPWLARFSAAVMKDAEARGLATHGWTRVEMFGLAGGLAVVLGFTALAFELAHVGASPRPHGRDHAGAWAAVAVVVWAAAVAGGARRRTARATRAGRDACGRWLGVRSHLRRDDAFAEQPPAAVTIWGRLLAYGVALGANRAAAAALTIGPDDPEHAWSREDGHWRRVRIRYPHQFGAGEEPRHVLLQGIVRLVLWGVVAFVVLPLVIILGWGALHDVTAHDYGAAPLAFVLLLFGVPVAGAVYVVARLVDAACRTWRGAADLRRTGVVEGPVVQLHDGWFAVDDGRASELIALRAPADHAPSVGERVRVRYRPRLRHVEEITSLPRSDAASSKESTDAPVQAPSPDTVGTDH